MTKTLPRSITSHDLLKMVAVGLMIVDHIGLYFFPDDLWWRVAGRTCVPLWFFLIGYARSRDLSAMLWGGAGLLIASNFVFGTPILPLNILVTIILVRLILDPFMERALRSTNVFWATAVMCALISLPTSLLTDYGTMGLLIAMLGYLLRRRETLETVMEPFWIFTLVVFVFTQSITFDLSHIQMVVLTLGSFAPFAAIYYFKPATYPPLTGTLPPALKTLIQLLGRRTLEIYVAHLLLFKVLGLFLDPERFPLFTISWI